MMYMRHFLTFLTVLLVSSVAVAQTSTLRDNGNAVQLMVDGKPFIVLGGELGNSSAACPEDIEANFAKLRKMGLNTVLVPAYWDLTEPVEGQFDFSLTDKVIEEARANDLKVVFLWFGAWKNSMSCYAPLWFKQDFEKYPRAYTGEGKPLEIASSFSDNVFAADNKAFTTWLSHVAEIDKDHGTVIMVQIENEIGMLEDARDHSAVADRHFNAPVPQELISFLKKNRKTLHPYMDRKWGENGYRTKGTWTEVFGEDVYTDEIFMAWHYAEYVEKMAQSARKIYDVPLFDKPFVQLETTRGCFNTCAFCVSGGEKPVRYQSIEQVKARLENIHAHAHSSVLAWRIPETGNLVGCRLWGRTESDTTKAM